MEEMEERFPREGFLGSREACIAVGAKGTNQR